MVPKAWLDVAAFRCPHCGADYVDSSWYAVEIGSDVDCGRCGKSFNTKRNLTDRVLLGFKLDEHGKFVSVRFAPVSDSST